MSHVVSIDVLINDLDCLAAAAKSCGLELVRGQMNYRWWGSSVGDYPIPQGFSAEDLGKCEHAIRIPGDNESYEIGVVRRRDGKAGYTLLFDFYSQYRLLDKVGGQTAAKLRQSYAREVAIKQARKAGFRLMGSTVKADGSIVLKLGRS
jgi:hypothetical protein